MALRLTAPTDHPAPTTGEATARALRSYAFERQSASTRDDLTGLPNRHALVEAIRHAASSAEARQLSGLVLFDLDDFCDVNDTLGHSVGDAFLTEIARRVRAAVPRNMLVARFGGDLFGVFSRKLTCPGACDAIARTVHEALARPFEIDGNELIASATSGMALSVPNQFDDLIRDADTALSYAKRTARGRTVAFRPEIAATAALRLRRTSELRLAVRGREITPFYQPVVDLASGKVVAVEALARWNHPKHGWVPPEEFISLAESTGLIGELGQQILEHACHDAAQWRRAGRQLRLAVNASGLQLVSPGIADIIDAALAASGYPADQLTIEITETAAMRDPEAAIRVLTSLRERGILLSLDDFGTGYSPLTALRDLPVEVIKLDRTFVAGLGSHAGENLAAGILHLGVSTNMLVVAEGIETRSQAERLGELGCHFGQGYLWSPAVPERDVLATIAHIESEGSAESALKYSMSVSCE